MAILFVIIFMDLVGFGLLLPLLAFYVQRVGASPEIITLVLGLYSIGQFVAAPIWGRLSDRFGRKPILALTSFGLGVSYLVLAYADTMALLIFSRLFGGIMAGNIAAAQAYISDITTPETRAKGMGMLGAAVGLGFVFGPAIGGMLGGADLATADFTSPALASAAVTIAAAFGVLLFLKESLTPELRAAAAAPKPPLRARLGSVFGRSALAMMIVASFLTFTAWATFESIYALWANVTFNYGPAQVGYVLAMMGVISALIQGGAIGPLTRRVGEKALAVTAVITLALGYLSIVFLSHEMLVLLACAVIAVGAALFNPSLSSLISKEAAGHERGAVLGVFQSASALGRVAGPAFSGVVFARLDPDAPFVLAGVLVLATLAFLLLTGRRNSKN